MGSLSMAERLRIAQVAPLEMPVRPEAGGSIQQLVWLMTEELVRLGHDVTLFATGDSRTSAALHAVYPRDYDHDETIWDWRLPDRFDVPPACQRAPPIDLLSSPHHPPAPRLT